MITLDGVEYNEPRFKEDVTDANVRISQTRSGSTRSVTSVARTKTRYTLHLLGTDQYDSFLLFVATHQGTRFSFLEDGVTVNSAILEADPEITRIKQKLWEVVLEVTHD